MSESAPQAEATISLAQLQEFIGIFGRLFALFAGVATVLYALGFVIVNTNLQRYGVYEFRLVQVQFITAGLSYLFYLALLVLIAIFVHGLVERGYEELVRPLFSREEERKPSLTGCFPNLLASGGRFISRGIIIVPAVIVLLLLFSDLYLGESRVSIRFADFKAAFTWAWATLTLTWLYVLFIRPRIVNRVTTSGRMEISPTGRLALETLALFIALMPALFLYGSNVYHRLPPAIGGGSPMIVEFVVDEEDAQERLRALGIDTDELGLTEKMKLLAQSESRYIVLTHERAVSLSTGDVRAIAYYILDKEFLPDYINQGIDYLEKAKREKERGQEKDQEVFDRYLKEAREELDQAIDVAEIRGDRDPTVHRAYYHLARSYAIQGEFVLKAVEDLQTAIELEPTDHDAVRADRDFQPFLSQEEFVEAIFGGFETAAREYNSQATDYERKGSPKEAEWSYIQALYLVTQTQAYKGETGEEKRKALLLEKASYHAGLAGLYAKQAKWGLAAAEYEKAATDAPTNVAYGARQVEALYSDGQWGEAIEVCGGWEENFKVHPPGAIACGNAYRDSREFNKAQDLYTQAISYTKTVSYTQTISTTTDAAEAHYQRARLYARQSDVEHYAELSLQDLAEATRLSPFLIVRSAIEPDFSAFKGDSRFLELLYPNIERIGVKEDEMTLIFNLPAPSPTFQFRLIALMRLQGLPPLISYQEETGEVVPARTDMEVSEDGRVWTFRLRPDFPYKASELQAQLLQTLNLGPPPEPTITPATPITPTGTITPTVTITPAEP